MRSASLFFVLAVAGLMLAPGALRDASAEDPPVPNASPLPAPQAAAAQSATSAGTPPAPDSGVTAQTQCIDDSSGFQSKNGRNLFVISIANKCDKRLTCKIYAYVVTARGPASAKTTLILAPASADAVAKQTYAMRVKSPGGTAQISRECRVI